MKKEALKILSLLLTISFMISCTEKKDNENVIYLKRENTPEIKVDYLKITDLSNDPNIIGVVNAVDIINDSSLVVSTTSPPQVIIYNRNGNQTQEIGKTGRGPNEYISPSIVKYSQGKIYVWCTNQAR